MSVYVEKTNKEIIQDRCVFIRDQIETLKLLILSGSAHDVIWSIGEIEKLSEEIREIVASILRDSLAQIEAHKQKIQKETDEKNKIEKALDRR